jgi:MSHA biogenesis protein MshQ
MAGAMSSSGLYTAPAIISTQQFVTVQATSAQDPTRLATALMTLNPGNGYAYLRTITISHAKVSGSSSLIDFPVLISLPSDSSLAANAQSSGNDILFTDFSGNKLNCEIETYNPASGQLIAWVQVPSVSPAADTVIYMFYGNPSAGNQQNRTSVWDANYQGVWHLANGATLSAADSTSNGNNGTISNAMAAMGEIDGGARFNGGNAWVDLGGGAGLRITGPITAEAWLNLTGWPANGYPEGLLGMGYSYASGWTGWMLETSTDNGGNHYLSWTSNNGTPHGVTSPSTLTTGGWHHLAGTFDGATWTMYLDGAANGSSADHTAPVNTGDDIVAGGLSTNGFGTIFVFNGLLDELRISNTARSSGWIATEYNNQLNPGAFVNVGAAQTNGN